MKYKNLGNTGLKSPRSVSGCMTFGVPERGDHPWTLPESQSRPADSQSHRTRHQFLRHRQCLLGRHLRGNRRQALKDYTRRDEVVIATKVFFPMSNGPNGRGLSRKAIFTAIDASLRRLGTDYVDLYQIHRWDYHDTDRGDARGAARRRQGRQGALSRRLLHVRLAVQQGAAPRPTSAAGPPSSACRTSTTCSTAKRSAKCCRSAAMQGLRSALEPARPRTPDARLEDRDGANPHRPLRQLPLRRHRGSRSQGRRARRGDRRGPRRTEGAGSARLAACKSPPSRHRSSAPRSPSISTMPLPHSSLKLTEAEIAQLEAPYVPHAVVGHS